MKKCVIAAVCAACLVIMCLFSFANSEAYDNNHLIKPYNYKEILKNEPCGTPPLVEDELKYAVEADSWLLSKSSYLLTVLKERYELAVRNRNIWRANRYTNTNYTVGKVGMGTFCFVDIYLDTDDFLNRKLNCVYRVRYRWHSKNAFLRYLMGSREAKDMPHRCEYQFKSYGQAVADKSVASSISWAVESRFEYRNESMPFMLDGSAPKPPWPFDEFIGYALNGKYKDFTPYPCHEYAKVLNANLKEGARVVLKPVLVHVATRRRIHLNIENTFGKISGDKGFGTSGNYNQAVLNTVDTVDTYSADILKIYRLAQRLRNRNGKVEPISGRLKQRLTNEIQKYWCGTFSEIEFEFERNILSAINTELSQTNKESSVQYLEEVKKAFSADVQSLANIGCDAFNSIGIKTNYIRFNKYGRDVDNLLKWRAKQHKSL